MNLYLLGAVLGYAQTAPSPIRPVVRARMPDKRTRHYQDRSDGVLRSSKTNQCQILMSRRPQSRRVQATACCHARFAVTQLALKMWLKRAAFTASGAPCVSHKGACEHSLRRQFHIGICGIRGRQWPSKTILASDGFAMLDPSLERLEFASMEN